MNDWISVGESLPISGPEDDKFKGGIFEQYVSVIANGCEQISCFYACWEECKSFDEDDEFFMDFDVSDVTHWKPIEEKEAP